MLFSVHCCLEIKSNQNYLIPASTFINVLNAYLSQHTHHNIHTHPQSVEAYLFLPSCSLCSMGLCLLNYHQHFIWTNLPWTHTSFLLQHNNFKRLLNIKILNVYKTTSRCLNLCWWVFSCWLAIENRLLTPLWTTPSKFWTSFQPTEPESRTAIIPKSDWNLNIIVTAASSAVVESHGHIFSGNLTTCQVGNGWQWVTRNFGSLSLLILIIAVWQGQILRKWTVLYLLSWVL